MTIEDMVKDSAPILHKYARHQRTGRLCGGPLCLELKAGFVPSACLKKRLQPFGGREHEVVVKDAEGALGQKESVAQVTPNQGG